MDEHDSGQLHLTAPALAPAAGAGPARTTGISLYRNGSTLSDLTGARRWSQSSGGYARTDDDLDVYSSSEVVVEATRDQGRHHHTHTHHQLQQHQDGLRNGRAGASSLSLASSVSSTGSGSNTNSPEVTGYACCSTRCILDSLIQNMTWSLLSCISSSKSVSQPQAGRTRGRSSAKVDTLTGESPEARLDNHIDRCVI